MLAYIWSGLLQVVGDSGGVKGDGVFCFLLLVLLKFLIDLFKGIETKLSSQIREVRSQLYLTNQYI